MLKEQKNNVYVLGLVAILGILLVAPTAKAGVTAWNNKMTGEIKSLEMKIGLAMYKMNNPVETFLKEMNSQARPNSFALGLSPSLSPRQPLTENNIDPKKLENFISKAQKEVSEISEEITGLENEKVKIDRSDFKTEYDYHRALNARRRGPKINGSRSAYGGSHG